jgi:hypothetical protein
VRPQSPITRGACPVFQSPARKDMTRPTSGIPWTKKWPAIQGCGGVAIQTPGWRIPGPFAISSAYDLRGHSFRGLSPSLSTRILRCVARPTRLQAVCPEKPPATVRRWLVARGSHSFARPPGPSRRTNTQNPRRSPRMAGLFGIEAREALMIDQKTTDRPPGSHRLPTRAGRAPTLPKAPTKQGLKPSGHRRCLRCPRKGFGLGGGGRARYGIGRRGGGRSRHGLGRGGEDGPRRRLRVPRNIGLFDLLMFRHLARNLLLVGCELVEAAHHLLLT